MKLPQHIKLFFLLLIGFNTSAQITSSFPDPILISLKGRIISASDSSSIPYANIINNRTHSGTITNNDGYFTLEVLNIDSLIVTSIGYENKVIYLPLNYLGNKTLTFTLYPVSYAVGEVEVKGDKRKIDLGIGTGKPVDIPIELRGSAFNEKPNLLAAVFNPISFWQYHLSKKEKAKREVIKEQVIQKKWEILSNLYNKKNVMEITGLNNEQADTFMIWFNSKKILSYTSSEYEVVASIKYYFQIYKKRETK